MSDATLDHDVRTALRTHLLILSEPALPPEKDRVWELRGYKPDESRWYLKEKLLRHAPAGAKSIDAVRMEYTGLYQLDVYVPALDVNRKTVEPSIVERRAGALRAHFRNSTELLGQNNVRIYSRGAAMSGCEIDGAFVRCAVTWYWLARYIADV